MNKRYEFQTPLAPGAVDPVNGVIRGVAVITSGITARGHDLHVDATTLKQLKECAEKMGSVPVKWNHRTGADAVNGYLDNFRIEGGKLLGDWHLLKTHDRYEQALELAQRMPKNVGLSAAFLGEDEKAGEKTFARCSELISVDLVAQPAANPDGLFEAKLDGTELASVDNKNTLKMDNDPNQQQQQAAEPTLKDVLAAITKLGERVEAIEAAAAGGEEDGFTLEDLAAMDPETREAIIAQAVEAGEISREEAEGIWAQCAANDGAQEGDPDGGGEAGGEPAGAAVGGEVGTALSALNRQVRELSARFEREDRAAEEAETAHYFEQIEGALTSLTEQNRQLKELNETLTTKVQAMELGFRAGRKPVSFSAEGAVVTTGDGKKHEFEVAVDRAVAEGKAKTRGEAIHFVRKNNPGLHEKWLGDLSEQTK